MDVTAQELPPAARSDARLAAWVSIVGVLALTNFIGNAEDNPPKDFVYLWSSALSQGIYLVVLLVIVLSIAGRDRTRDMLALRRPVSWPKALGLGLALIAAVYIFVAALSPLLDPGGDQGLTPSGWDSSRAPQFVANFIVIAVLVPIVEELMFRGLGFSLLERFGEWFAIVAIGVLFAAVHGIPAALPVLALFGGGLAYIRSRSNSVVPGMVVHGSFNAISLILAVTLTH
jgi:membrane protease YdiL (CAAX protease family)